MQRIPKLNSPIKFSRPHLVGLVPRIVTTQRVEISGVSSRVILNGEACRHVTISGVARIYRKTWFNIELSLE